MLTEKQIHDFKKKLDDRFNALREVIRLELLKSDDHSYINLAGRVQDSGDASVADLLVDLELADIDRHIQEIRDIDTALMRIATGNYGVCIDCEAPIPVSRLEVFPTAKRCRPCKAEYERLNSGRIVPSL